MVVGTSPGRVTNNCPAGEWRRKRSPSPRPAGCPPVAMKQPKPPKPSPNANTSVVRLDLVDAQDLRALASMCGIRTRDALAICLAAWRRLDDDARLELLTPYLKFPPKP